MASSPNSTVPDPSALLPPLPRIKIDDTFGAVLLGTCIGLTLFGLNAHQCYRYFRLYPNDRWLFRWVVIVTILLEVMHTVLGIHICYYYLVTNYFNPLALRTGVWSIKLMSLNMGSVMFVAQSFFACRVYMLGPKFRIISAVVAVLLVGEIAFATAATVETFVQVTFDKFSKVSWLITVGYAMAVGADGILATTLLVIVRRSRSTLNAHNKEEPWMDIAVVYVINTGLLTSFLSIVSVFCSAFAPNLIYVGFNTVATRLYANSLLSVLNSRRSSIDHGAEGFETGSLGLAAVAHARPSQVVAEQWNVPQIAPPPPTKLHITVTTEMVRDAANGDTSSMQEERKLKGYSGGLGHLSFDR